MASSREVYPHGHHESVLRSHGRRTATNSAGYLLPYLRLDDRLLDVGVGPGTITIDLAGRLGSGWVTGIDNAEAAVGQTQRLAADRGVDRLTIAVGDVYALDFADHSFDVVHAHQVLQHLRDPVAALAEMRRVCAPDGLVAVRDGDYGGMTWYPDSAALSRWMELYGQVARSGGGEPDAGRRLRSWATRAGFTQLRCGASTWCYSTPEDVGWWSDTWAERLRSSTFAELAIAGGFATRAELDGLARGWRDWATSPDAWFVIVHGEILACPSGAARFA